MNRSWCKVVKSAWMLGDKPLATAFYTNPVEKALGVSKRGALPPDRGFHWSG